MKSVYIKAHSHKTGLAFASSEQGALTIVVLPKIWNENKDKLRVLWNKKQVVFTLYENQSAQVDIDGSEKEIAQRYQLFEEILQQSDVESEGKSYKEEQNKGPLITEIGFFRTSEYLKITHQEESQTIQSILRLLLLIHHTKIEQTDDVFIKKLQDYTLSPLTHLRYLNEIEKVLHNFRRGYVAQSDKLQVIRGRVDVRDVGRAEEAETTQLLCHYDEFTKGTPLMRILTAALEVVASGNWLSFRKKQKASDNFGVEIRNRGAKYRRYLNSIVAYPRSRALVEARKLRLNRMEKQFQPALELAKMVLENSQNIFSRQGKLRSNAWCWSVMMSDVWEGILVQGLARSLGQENVVHYEKWVADKSTDNGVFSKPVPAPFVGGSPRRPDILLKNKGQNWIVDAKYSLKEKERDQGKEASRNYQFQMFIYANLTSEDGRGKWADELALIYPTREPFVFRKAPEMSSLGEGKEKMPRLFQVACSFPMSDVFDLGASKKGGVSASSGWERYVEQLTGELRAFFVSL